MISVQYRFACTLTPVPKVHGSCFLKSKSIPYCIDLKHLVFEPRFDMYMWSILTATLKAAVYNAGGSTQREAGSVVSLDTSNIVANFSQVRDAGVKVHKVKSKISVKEQTFLEKLLPCLDTAYNTLLLWYASMCNL
jgi:hypothetical protein